MNLLYDKCLEFMNGNYTLQDEIEGTYYLGSEQETGYDIYVDVETDLSDKQEPDIMTTPYIAIPRYKHGKVTNEVWLYYELNDYYQYIFYELQNTIKVMFSHIKHKVVSECIDHSIFNSNSERITNEVYKTLISRGYNVQSFKDNLLNNFDISVNC